MIERKKIKIIYISKDQSHAIILTKALDIIKFQNY